MKSRTITYLLTLLALAPLACESDRRPFGPSIAGKSDIYAAYEATQIRIVGLTEITKNPETGLGLLTAYVDLLDEFDCKVKSPGNFRFELYNFVPLSNDPKGRRLHVWGDIELTDPEKNHSYWRDFLRTYKFELQMDFQPPPGQKFVLEATFITPRGKRLSDLYEFQYGS